MKLHEMHMSPEEKLANQANRTADAVESGNKKLDEIKEATLENNPKEVVRKLEEIKSASLITNQNLKKIEKKEYPGKIKVELDGIDILTIKGEKGEKGDRGEKGEIGERGEKGNRGERGERGETGSAGKNGKDGKDGKDGIGIDGRAGKDGSPDTPDEIIEKINEAKLKIDAKQIKGLLAILDRIDEIGKFPKGMVLGGGSDITSYSFVENEIVSGSGTSWTLAYTPTAGTVHLFAARNRLYPTTDYTISGATITTVASWVAGDLIADYRHIP